MQNRRGILFILSSPSGAGKSTLARSLMEWDNTLSFSVSATTRSPRSGEIEGREYFFKTDKEFLTMVDNNEMLEHARVFGNYYGSPREPIETAIESGKDVIFDIDWQGGQQLKNSALADDSVSIFILPPSLHELRQRLCSRGQDSLQVINDRMKKCYSEISHWAEYDYCLINRDLETSLDDIKSILRAERLKRHRQLSLVDMVRDFDNEREAIL